MVGKACLDIGRLYASASWHMKGNHSQRIDMCCFAFVSLGLAPPRSSRANTTSDRAGSIFWSFDYDHLQAWRHP